MTTPTETRNPLAEADETLRELGDKGFFRNDLFAAAQAIQFNAIAHGINDVLGELREIRKLGLSEKALLTLRAKEAANRHTPSYKPQYGTGGNPQ